MISLDAGDMLPKELTDILARLRNQAYHMPPAQLQTVLAAQWGKDWRRRFARFGASPIAAASIGQVHKALTHDGRELAVKVQYPGVRESIDADVDNVATLLKISGLLPKAVDIAPLLAEAKRQLHEEADYVREGEQMARFAILLADAPDFIVPMLDPEFSGDRVLAMSFIAGTSVESLVDAPQEERDRVMQRLIALVLRELFEFGLMQTDPNFANFRYQRDTGKLVACDATRCPHAIDGVNHAPFAAFGGWSGGINAKAKDAVKDAAYAFISYVSQPGQSNVDVTIGSTGFNPYRLSQLTYNDAWKKAGMSEEAAKSHLGAINASLNSPNMTLDLRVANNQRYQQIVQDQTVARYLAGEIDVNATMKAIEDGWNEITEELGKDKQLSAYKATIGAK
jgi:hypothetical protein